MHIKYPKQRGFFSWEELGCLAKALGYQKTLFYKNIPPEYHKERIPGLDIKVLHGDLHRTYNMHDALYNSSVVEKAVDMLSFKYLSFQELHEVRVAFQLYEHEDTLGLVIDEHILLRTLKACGRSVSPIRLMQHIKHADTHVQDRLMLYEFMDLLLLCERDSDIHVPTVPQVSGIDPRNNLFRICDFQSILMPQEEKKITQLNSAYEQGLLKPLLGSRKPTQPPSWREQQPFFVDFQPRLELVSRHQQRIIELTVHLDYSNKKVLNARCGRAGRRAGRPFVDLNDVTRKEKRNRKHLQIDSPLHDVPIVTEKEENPTSRVNFSSSPPRELRITPDRPSTTDSQSYLKSFAGTTPQKLSRMSRSREREILVTPRDVHNANTKIENLNWDIETQSVRQERKSDKYLQKKFPQQYQIIRHRVEQRKDLSPLLRRELSLDLPKDLQEERSQDHLQVSPRRSIPTRENIYSTLKSRLQATNTLLDYGDIQVPHSSYTRFLAQQVDRKRTQSTENKLMVEKPGTLPGEEDLRSKGHTGGEVVELLEKFQVDRKRTKKNETNLKVENPGTLPGEEDLRSKGHTGGEVVELLEKFQVDRKRTKKPDRNLMVENPGTLPGKEDLRSKGHTDEVVDLLEKFQEANLVASGRKGFVHNDKHEWMHTTFV